MKTSIVPSKWQLRAVRWKKQSAKLVVRAHTDVRITRTVPRIEVELLLPREPDLEHQPDKELTSSDSSDEELTSSDSGSDVSSEMWC